MADIFANIKDTVEGWNEKILMTSDELSKMVPFVELFAIYKFEGKEDKQSVGDKQTLQQGFQVKLLTESGAAETVTLVPLFSLLEQQSSIDPITKRLNKSRGIGGVQSLEVSVQNLELGSYVANVGVVVPTFETEVATNNVLRKTVFPMSEWILMYGWAREGSGLPVFNPISNDNVIDLAASHKGYYKILKTVLFDFQWQVDTNKIMKGNLRMGSPISNLVTFAQMSNYREKIIDLLSKPQTLKSKSKTKDLPDQIGYEEVVTVEQNVNNKKTKVDKPIAQFYSLGWIIEAIKQSVDPADQERFFKDIYFQKFDEPKKIKYNYRYNSQNEQREISIKNTSEFLVSKNALNSIIRREESALSLIKQLCDEVNNTNTQIVNLTIDIQKDGHSLSIVEADTLVFRTAQVEKFQMNFSSIGSLISEALFEGRAARELTFGIQMLLTSDNGAISIYNIFKTLAAEKIDDTELKKRSMVAYLIRKFEKENPSEGAFQTLGNRTARWKTYLSSKETLEQVLIDVQSNNEVPVGFALKNYFMQLTLNIHGTAAIPPFSHVNFRGVLPGIDGDYWIYETSDTIVPGRFTTSLGCVLSEPFE